ncbi:hypothetical protein [Corynebacterium propinquum]
MEKQDKPAATTESFARSSSSTVDKTEHTQEAERNSDSSQAAGTTSYKTRVAEHVVERAIYSVPGTTDVDGGLLSRNYPRFDIRLDQERQVASVDVVIAVVWPSPAVRVATEVRTAIAEALDIFMGYEATRVNVTIGEAIPSTQRISRDDVAARDRLSPRSITVGEIEVIQPVIDSKTDSLREISVEDSAPLREVTTTRRIDELTEVETRELAVRHKVETPWPKPLGVIAVAEPTEPVSVEAPEPTPLREIRVTELETTRTVTAPPERKVISPTTPKQQKLAQVDAPEQQPLREVYVPAPAALREISVRELPEVSVATPKQQPLRDVTLPELQELTNVNTRTFAPRSVSLPPERKLLEVVAHKPRVRSVTAPKPRKPRAVDVRRKKLRKIQAPRPVPLRDIEVADLGHPRKPEAPKPRKLRKVRTPMKQQLRKPYAPADHPFRSVSVPQPQPLRAIYLKDPREVAREIRGGSRG